MRTGGVRVRVGCEGGSSGGGGGRGGGGGGGGGGGVRVGALSDVWWLWIS